MKNWEKEWKDMPEFIQKDLGPPKTIFVHFKTQEDMEEFSKLIGQQITSKTKSIWYPEVKSKQLKNLRYVDEEG